jgi:hypothetical protein
MAEENEVKNYDIQMGVPTLVLLPAHNYVFKVYKEVYKIKVPRNGFYNEIDPKVFKTEDGGFYLLDNEASIMYVPAITKVLFAVKRYPKLEANQLFAPLVLLFGEDEVEIAGQIIEMLDPSTVKSTAKEGV